MQDKGLYKAMGELDLLFNYIEEYLVSKRRKHWPMTLSLDQSEFARVLWLTLTSNNLQSPNIWDCVIVEDRETKVYGSWGPALYVTSLVSGPTL